MKKTCNDSEFISDSDLAWEKIFTELKILDTIEKEDVFYLSASQIKEISKREPRLMARMESSEDRSAIFDNNDLTILKQGKRGDYVIGKFDAFLPLEYSSNKNRKVLPYIESDVNDPLHPKREPEAILNAFNYGMFSEILNCDQDELKMVSFGRRGTDPFSYSIRLKNKDCPFKVGISSTQMELDGVFENIDCLLNVEAKINPRPDFISRQLYYPYRALSELTDKPILNVFLTATVTGSIYAHVFKVKEKEDYNSMEAIDVIRYDFYEPISISDIREVMNGIQIVLEPTDIMFPQADSVDRLFQVLDIVKTNPGITASAIGEKMDLSGRQGAYYSAACVYLGLLRRDKYGQSYKYRLTEYAKDLVEATWKKRNLMMIEAIARHLVFYHFIKQYLDTQEPPSKTEITEWLGNNIDKLNCDNGTPARRAGTVLGWINWVIQITTYDDC